MKVIVNGNGFYYGRALLTYNPYITNDEVTVNRTFIAQDLIQASQKPHFLIDPTTSQGGEMTLPFIWPENYLDITKAGWPDQMGEVDIHDFGTLQHANGGTDPISIVVFVWAENVTLSVPTTNVAQSGVEDGDYLDEFGFPLPYEDQGGKGSNTTSQDEFTTNGLISKPASAVARVADALSMIPVLAPYAKATSLVASRLGDAARIFGYSRPQVLADSNPFVPRYLGNLCNSDAPETLVKLTLDSKNELSVDTRLMGLAGEDELTINSICQRWSYWRSFAWPEAATTDTMLTSMLVAPIYGSTLTAGPVQEIHSTALAYGATPFDAWQGSIKFRFNVVCSEYHRGRIRIVYNPATNPAGPIPFNQVYSTIVDISENRDFEYEVKWADIRAWARNFGIASIPGATIHDDVNPVGAGGTGDNGSITVYVVNELATPSTAAAAVTVQVWVKAGDDFAVSCPSPDNLKLLSPFEQQSETEVMATSEDTSNAPTGVAEVASFAPGEYIPDNNQYLVYQGERVVSFRELMRRYVYWNSYFPILVGIRTIDRRVEYEISDFPFYRGWDPNGQDSAVDSGATEDPYNFVTMTLINYLTPAFACRRGSIRHKVCCTSTISSSATSGGLMQVGRAGLTGVKDGTSYELFNTDDSGIRKNLQDSALGSLGGTHATVTAANPVLEYETPFYTLGQRFVPGRMLNIRDNFTSGHDLSIDVRKDAESIEMRLDKFVSTGEDFQLGLFTGAPIMYAYNNPFSF